MTQSTKGAEFVEFPDIEEEESGNTNNPAPAEAFEEQVNAAVKGMTQNEDGTWKVPEGLPEHVAYAANLEKRRRDTQSALAKTTNRLEMTEKERDTLRDKILESAHTQLTKEQKLELQDLKDTDPDAWIAKKAEYEQSAVEAIASELDELSSDPDMADETARRAELLADCLNNNPGLVLNDEVFENDLPPRLTKQLYDGEVTFEKFLEDAVKFLQPAVKVANTDDDDTDETNLGNLGGGTAVDDASIELDAASSYRNEIY